MRWEVKAAIQATLSRIPFGYALHRKLQDLGGSSRLDVEDHYGRKRKFLKRVEEHGLPLAGRDFLEIGTGWHPVLPVLLHLLDARQVTTIDVNPWLTRASLAETFHAFQGIAGRVAADFGKDAARAQATMDRLCTLVEDASVPILDVLKAANIRYGLPVDACKTPYEAGSFDYVVSSNVLEHVPPEVIRGMFTESRRVLKPGGYNLHHVNPGDHFSVGDSRVTTVHFVRYSSRAWYWIGGSGLAYHNRLRCVEYARLLESAGFTVTYSDTEIDPRGLEALEKRQVLPHPDFAAFTNEELSGNVIDVFARAPLGEGASENA
jgi:SAM-dependent methyltransferase